jgi:hypothetical protein
VDKWVGICLSTIDGLSSQTPATPYDPTLEDWDFRISPGSPTGFRFKARRRIDERVDAGVAALRRCGDATDNEQPRLGALLGPPSVRNPDLALLIASWQKLPEHVRLTIKTVVLASKSAREA